jgi:hypothetical protein
MLVTSVYISSVRKEALSKPASAGKTHAHTRVYWCARMHASRACVTRKLCAKFLSRTKTECLDEERQKKLDSPDKCVLVRRRLDSEAVPHSLRPAPWGGYCAIDANDEDGIDIAQD